MTRTMWEDELATYAFATSPYSTIEQIVHPMDDRPPLFYLCVRLFTGFIHTDVYLRLPIILFSILSCYVMYKAVEKLDKHAGLIILFLFSFSLYRVEYSWQLRDYGFMSLFASCSFYFFVSYMQSLFQRNRVNWHALYEIEIFCFLGSMTNYIFLIFTICLFLCILATTVIRTYRRTHKIPWDFVTKLFALQVPLVLIMTYYLSNQIEFIKRANDWIPETSVYAYLLIQAVFLGFSNIFYDLYSQDVYFLYYFGTISLFIFALFGFFISMLEKNKQKIQPVIRVLFYSGIWIYVIGVIGVFICSKLINTNLILIRTFLRIGSMLLVSYGLGIYITIETMIKKAYWKNAITLVAVICIGVFAIMYVDWYQPNILDLQHKLPKHYGLARFEKIYHPGDQVIFLPAYYTVLYPTYFWKFKPERFSSLFLFTEVYNREIHDFFVPYQELLRQQLPYIQRETYLSTSRIILLNWNIENSEYRKIDTYCHTVKHGEFKTIYKQEDMYIAVCEEHQMR